MVFDVLISCKEGKRNQAIERLKEFRDIKNIQERKNQNEVLAQVDSNDPSYVKTNVVDRIRAIEVISDASMQN
ncbi:hypothetical protein NsoK4_01420 [Nitrosopumilus sp. K4]|uniref:hypothetical protein n=1 Tax=Nitrosopumilus sp. K4 TaxID=2795383 RepID=UPI001BA8C798|nr:hypothetical protein [Nitrosopumilus sp. K4]QUC64968.1 hypothetical protein NsoK4_01420 [Nitrosopumilus sp. K4]